MDYTDFDKWRLGNLVSMCIAFNFVVMSFLLKFHGVWYYPLFLFIGLSWFCFCYLRYVVRRRHFELYQ